VRLVIADDSLLVREGLARLLADAGCEITGTAADATGLIREVHLTKPDAVVVDIKMPPSFTDEGIRAAHTLRRTHPAIGVLVLSQYMESEWAMRLISDAPEHLGYLIKDRVDHVDVLIDALNRVIAGECVVDPTIVDRLMHRPRGDGPLGALTARELEVLALMAEGRSNAAIADRLYLSPKTLEVHIRKILQRLGLEESRDDHRRVLAVLEYLRAPADPGSGVS
jgi:DNA-binding NarL/FixJ family response regulator